MSPSNPVQIHEHLHGTSWPADRAELRRVAERNEADEMVLVALDEIPDRTYESPADLTSVLDPTLPASAAGSGPRGVSSEGDDLENHPSAYNPPRVGG